MAESDLYLRPSNMPAESLRRGEQASDGVPSRRGKWKPAPRRPASSWRRNSANEGALDGSGGMNVWLHAQVMTKLAESGDRALPVRMTRAGMCPACERHHKTDRPMRVLCTRPYSYVALNVSQLSSVPEFSPIMNQRVRCCDEPWVKASGTT